MTFRIGMDLGGTKIEGVVLDENGTQVLRKRVNTEREKGYETVIQNICALYQELRTHVTHCSSIGIGTPGAVSAKTGLMKNSNTLLLNQRNVKADLEQILDVEVIIENDANCFCLAEAIHGAAKGHAMVFGVILGTGVGGGLAFDGKLWRGPQHIAGEWGHHSISPENTGDYSGIPGTVESYLCGPAFEKAYAAEGGQETKAIEIMKRFRQGEERATRVFEAYLEHFGRALANIINILDPSCIVLGGGMSNVDELYTLGTKAIERYVFNDELTTPIVRNALGDSAGVIGAAYLVPLQ